MVSQIFFDAQLIVRKYECCAFGAEDLEDKRMIGKRFPLLLRRLRGQLTNGKDHTGDYDGLILLWHCRDISKLSADCVR